MREIIFTILGVILGIFCIISDIDELSQYKGQYWIFGALFLILILVFLLKKYGTNLKNQILILIGLILFFVVVFFIEIKFGYLFIK